jgi:hypothetical protein
MTNSILASNGISREDYYGIDGNKDRHFNRVLILGYWRNRGTITLEDWLERYTIEAYRQYSLDKKCGMTA